MPLHLQNRETERVSVDGLQWRLHVSSTVPQKSPEYIVEDPQHEQEDGKCDERDSDRCIRNVLETDRESKQMDHPDDEPANEGAECNRQQDEQSRHDPAIFFTLWSWD
jgi:hypothetical protein